MRERVGGVCADLSKQPVERYAKIKNLFALSNFPEN